MATTNTTPATDGAAPAASVPAPAAPVLIKVRSVSPAGTFRRLGREFTHQGVTLAQSALTAKQWDLLAREPMLVVAQVAAPA
ncbi:hypothetical protein [Sphaerotilus sp.]|uniref:hypothetical protein n=1 Tax=Sphaerotilus sp. TaxID=2093942 RepID=UPI00286EAA82|nr:hypothetical protein [Sphaerotilus sp.]